jgi:hypothetical protein
MSPTSFRALRLRFTLPKALAATAVVVVAMAATALAATSIGLTSFLLRSGEQTGFAVPAGSVHTQTTVKAFVNFSGGTKKQKQAEAAELEKAGFVAASDEQLRASHGRQGFSLVMEFTGSAGARLAAAKLFKMAVQGQKGAKLGYFRVKGISSARGVAAVSSGVSTANVYWTEGRCAFGSGDYVPKHAGALTKPVTSGALALHARTKGTCP